MADISPETVRLWRIRYDICQVTLDPATGDIVSYTDDGAEPTIPRLFAFFGSDKKARSEARIMRLNNIKQAGQAGNWQADAWWLERNFPDEYGRRERRDVNLTISIDDAEKAIDAEIARLEEQLSDND